MPAKAGIQRTKLHQPEPWIPAFAGMTGQRGCEAFPKGHHSVTGPSPVVPAQAGTLGSEHCHPWIPAFAGMTVKFANNRHAGESRYDESERVPNESTPDRPSRDLSGVALTLSLSNRERGRIA